MPAMGRLTTHVLDTTRGKPGHGITVALYRLDGEQRRFVTQTVTNDDGRCDAPLLEGEAFQSAVYELVFSVGPYFAAASHPQADTMPADTRADDKDDVQPRFLDDVVIRFGVARPDQHYHVPLLITPFSYSTYRGS
jgi:5-hydroxyisourate hydrolase